MKSRAAVAFAAGQPLEIVEVDIDKRCLVLMSKRVIYCFLGASEKQFSVRKTRQRIMQGFVSEMTALHGNLFIHFFKIIFVNYNTKHQQAERRQPCNKLEISLPCVWQYLRELRARGFRYQE